MVIKRRGSFFNDFFRLALGLVAVSLPIACLWVSVTAPKASEYWAYVTNQIWFVPWATSLISLAVLTWLTEERR